MSDRELLWVCQEFENIDPNLFEGVVSKFGVPETPRPRLAIAYSEDWKGLYVDGKLVAENHDIKHDVLLKHAGVECEFIDAYGDEWVEKTGGFPLDIKDLRRSRG